MNEAKQITDYDVRHLQGLAGLKPDHGDSLIFASALIRLWPQIEARIQNGNSELADQSELIISLKSRVSFLEDLTTRQARMLGDVREALAKPLDRGDPIVKPF